MQLWFEFVISLLCKKIHKLLAIKFREFCAAMLVTNILNIGGIKHLYNIKDDGRFLILYSEQPLESQTAVGNNVSLLSLIIISDISLSV